MSREWSERYDEALRRAIGRPDPGEGASPGERHLLALIQPTFHAPLAVELTDLGEAHELAAALIAESASFASAVASGRPDAVLPPAPAWHRATLAPGPLADLRTRLDALDARRWPPAGPGRDGLALTLWLRDHRGDQRLAGTTATHDPDAAPFALAAVLLDLVAVAMPALGAAAGQARRYVRG